MKLPFVSRKQYEDAVLLAESRLLYIQFLEGKQAVRESKPRQESTSWRGTRRPNWRARSQAFSRQTFQQAFQVKDDSEGAAHVQNEKRA